MMIPISVGKWRRVSNQCEWSRIEDRGGGGREGEEGQDKNAGRNDRRDREDPGGGGVSSHRHIGNCDSLIIIDYEAKMTFITYIHTYMHTHIHTIIHTYIHTYIQSKRRRMLACACAARQSTSSPRDCRLACKSSRGDSKHAQSLSASPS